MIYVDVNSQGRHEQLKVKSEARLKMKLSVNHISNMFLENDTGIIQLKRMLSCQQLVQNRQCLLKAWKKQQKFKENPRRPKFDQKSGFILRFKLTGHQTSIGPPVDVYIKSGLHIDVHLTSKGRLIPTGKQLMSEPTHLFPTSSLCIDLIFTNQSNMIMNSGVFPLIYQNCYHQIVFAKANLNIFFPPPYTRPTWDYG